MRSPAFSRARRLAERTGGLRGRGRPDQSAARAEVAANALSSRASTAVTWTNWAGNQTCSPKVIERPSTEERVQEIVRAAAERGDRVRAVASGHSFTAIACSDEVLVSLERLNRVLSIDRLNRLVTVEAGITLDTLNERLANVGLAMTNLGDIAYQSLAGATSTGTHGTGLRFGGLATHIRALRLVTATGDTIDCSPLDNPELFSAARLGLGAFGIITRITIEVEPAFNLHAIEEPRALDDVLSGWMTEVDAHDHFEFFWIPGTTHAMTKTNRRTDEPARPLSRPVWVRDKILGENIGFGALCTLGSARPSLIPRLNGLVASAPTRAEYIDASHRVFASPRWVKFVEMEYSVPVEDLPTIVRRIDAEVARAGLSIQMPIEARSAAADDIPLSTATGRPSGYIAVHTYKGRPFEPYFRLVESIMDEYDGRPHWGKMHFQTAATLAPRYPQWAEFQRVRRSLDPEGRFSNAYLDRVLGIVS